MTISKQDRQAREISRMVVRQLIRRNPTSASSVPVYGRRGGITLDEASRMTRWYHARAFVLTLEEQRMKMFCWISILLLTLSGTPSRLAAQGSKDTLTNQDIIDLVKTDLSDDIVVAKIKSSASKFDTSTAALKDLKADGVSSAVILAMVQASGKPADPPAAGGTANAAASSSDSAHIRVYRPHLVPGSGINPPILIDDKVVAKLGNAKRFSVKVSPGPHTIKSDDKTSEITIDAKDGQEFYVSVQEIPGRFPKLKGKLTLVLIEQGRGEYRLTKPLEEDRKIEKDMIENDTDTSN
jgi:hypothetical protein